MITANNVSVQKYALRVGKIIKRQLLDLASLQRKYQIVFTTASLKIALHASSFTASKIQNVSKWLMGVRTNKMVDALIVGLVQF